MKILDEGTPLTAGEAYSIIRRSRDMSYAKKLPSFGLQFRAALTAQQQGPPPRRNDGAAAASGTAAAQQQAFASQNVVSLTAVQSLWYLQNIAAASYGPPSVFSRASGAQLGVPGSASCVRAVDQRLTEWESAGRLKEQQEAEAIQRIVKETAEEVERQARANTAASPRVANPATSSFPTAPSSSCASLTSDLIGSKHNNNNNNNNVAVSSSNVTPSFGLFEREFMTLLELRPNSEVRVAAIVNDLEGRVGGDTTLASEFSSKIIQIFQKTAAAETS